jgi:hypothetical protein
VKFNAALAASSDQQQTHTFPYVCYYQPTAFQLTAHTDESVYSSLNHPTTHSNTMQDS